MKIPKSFKLFGHTITVKIDNDYCDHGESYGVAKYKRNEILLTDKANGEKITDSRIETTCIHEVLHHIFNDLGYQELSEDEKLIKALSNAIHQVLTTVKYE